MEEAALRVVVPVYVFTVPEDVEANGVSSVGLRELTAQDELMCAKRAGGDSIRLAFEMAKQALAEVNEKKVSLVDGSADKAWDSFSSQIRQLVLTAYAEIHNVDEAKTKNFLKSRQVKVG